MATGDQIYAFRELWNFDGMYMHHGIDCGDGSVIHYRKPSEIVERTSLEVFARGEMLYQLNYPHNFCFLPEIVVQRAENRLGENNYNLLFNNCEHFATWCKTGISESKQIKEFIPALAKLKKTKLYEPIKQALQGTTPKNARHFLDDALADIKLVWEQIQPEYKQALAEMESWHQVAQQALAKNREDLAKAALKRKLEYKKRADELKTKLDDLGQMTETLILNSNSL